MIIVIEFLKIFFASHCAKPMRGLSLNSHRSPVKYRSYHYTHVQARLR